MKKFIEPLVGIGCMAFVGILGILFILIPIYVVVWTYTGQDVLVGTSRTQTDIPRSCLIATHIVYDESHSTAQVKSHVYPLPENQTYHIEHYASWPKAVTGTVLRYGVLRCVSVGPWSLATTEDYIGHS